MAEELEPVEDWSTLVAGERYQLRSGADKQEAVYLEPVDGTSALFLLDGDPPPETYSQDDWTVYRKP